MKKIIALLSALVLILAFAGCAAGNSGSQSQAETKAAESSKAEEETNAVETIQGSDATGAKNVGRGGDPAIRLSIHSAYHTFR